MIMYDIVDKKTHRNWFKYTRWCITKWAFVVFESVNKHSWAIRTRAEVVGFALFASVYSLEAPLWTRGVDESSQMDWLTDWLIDRLQMTAACGWLDCGWSPTEEDEEEIDDHHYHNDDDDKYFAQKARLCAYEKLIFAAPCVSDGARIRST